MDAWSLKRENVEEKSHKRGIVVKSGIARKNI